VRDTAAVGRHRLTQETIDDEDALRGLLGGPSEIVRAKRSERLNPLTRQFVERSPFLCLATCDARGELDVSPRGDPPGFVRILDDVTLLVPERPGNKLADSLRNILENARVGLLFFVPGVDDTLRVNGRATLVTDAQLLAPCVVEDKVPKLGILVDVESAFTHCAKAFLRAHFWDPTRFVDRATLPSHGEILRAIRGDDFDAAKHDRERAARYARRDGFY
jgi:PPOX class probable FMN-dependent enzyme